MHSGVDRGTGTSDRRRDRRSSVLQIWEETVEVDHAQVERIRGTSRWADRRCASDTSGGEDHRSSENLAAS